MSLRTRLRFSDATAKRTSLKKWICVLLVFGRLYLPKYVLNLKKANLKELKKTLQNLPWATAKSLRRSCKSLIRSKYNAYLRQLADNIQDNSKKFWSFYSVKTRTRKLPLAIKKDVNSNSLVTDTLEKANLFNNYFNSVFSKPCKEPLAPGLCPIVPPLRELSMLLSQWTKLKVS